MNQPKKDEWCGLSWSVQTGFEYFSESQGRWCYDGVRIVGRDDALVIAGAQALLANRRRMPLSERLRLRPVLDAIRAATAAGGHPLHALREAFRGAGLVVSDHATRQALRIVRGQ